MSLYDLFNRRAAHLARLAGAGVHRIILLEVAGLAVAVGKVAQGAAALRDGCAECFVYGLHQSGAAWQAEMLGRRVTKGRAGRPAKLVESDE